MMNIIRWNAWLATAVVLTVAGLVSTAAIMDRQADGLSGFWQFWSDQDKLVLAVSVVLFVLSWIAVQFVSRAEQDKR